METYWNKTELHSRVQSFNSRQMRLFCRVPDTFDMRKISKCIVWQCIDLRLYCGNVGGCVLESCHVDTRYIPDSITLASCLRFQTHTLSRTYICSSPSFCVSAVCLSVLPCLISGQCFLFLFRQTKLQVLTLSRNKYYNATYFYLHISLGKLHLLLSLYCLSFSHSVLL